MSKMSINTTIVELFEKTVKEYPHNTALIFNGINLTYQEFDVKINQLTNHLRKHGILRGSKVAIYLDRGIEIVVCMLAVLKAGACYVPIDSKYPNDRIEFMIKDSEASVLISSKKLMQGFYFKGATYIDIHDNNLFKNESSKDLRNNNKPTDLACLLYTSGSTGKPKGVMLTHRNIVNFSLWYIKTKKIKESDALAIHSSFSFDATIMGTYPAFFAGAKSHIVPEEIRVSLVGLHKFLFLIKSKAVF